MFYFILFPGYRKMALPVHFVKNVHGSCQNNSFESFKDNSCPITMSIAIVLFHRVHLWIFLWLAYLILDPFWLVRHLSNVKMRFQNRNWKETLAMVNKLLLFFSSYSYCYVLIFFKSAEIDFYLLYYFIILIHSSFIIFFI